MNKRLIRHCDEIKLFWNYVYTRRGPARLAGTVDVGGGILHPYLFGKFIGDLSKDLLETVEMLFKKPY